MRSIIALVCVAVLLGAGTAVWKLAIPAEAEISIGTSESAPHTFDTNGGQALRPRWNREEGEGDGAIDH